MTHVALQCLYLRILQGKAEVKANVVKINADQTMRIAATAGRSISRIITISFTSDNWFPYKRTTKLMISKLKILIIGKPL